jgi:alcohol dehydrogenase (cytochrome c)
MIHAQRTAACTHGIDFWAWVALFLLYFVPVAVPSAAAQEPTTSRIEHADKEPQNWLSFYGNYRGWSYSELNQITRENVKQLVPVWAFPAGFPPSGTGLRPGLEATPLVVDGVLYLEGMQNNIYAMEAATGRPLWSYTYKWPETVTYSIRGARGLAFGDGRVYMGTQDNHLVAVDVATGEQAWNVHVEENSECKCRITAPPLFVKGKVITGNAGSGYEHMRGHVNAYDAKTGALLWHFETIPSPGEPGSETWAGAPDDYWKTGGGGTWFTGTYDPELNLVYWGTGDPTPIEATTRPGANLYTASLLALDADTGRLKWYFQETPHDLYDYDSAPEPIILDMDVAGRKHKLILHPTKNGFAYEYERETGKFVRAFPYSSANWTRGIDENGRPTETVIPKQQKDFLICPSIHTGARGIPHSAYSPRTGWWYTTDFEICTHLKDGSDQDELNPSVPPNISAFDPATGKKQWTFNTNYYNMSSLLSTAGDLIFGGDLEGSAFALDARTGQKLWSFNTGGRIASAPVSFSVNGRQYVAIASGGGSETETRLTKFYPDPPGRLPQPASTLFVFALPERTR